MKPLPTLLVCSLAANAALLATVVFRPGMLHLSRVPAARDRAVSVQAAPHGQHPAEAPGVSKAWAQLSSGELPDIRDRLKAAGFPPEVIRAILQALLARQFEGRRAALLAAEPQKPYWKRNGWMSLDPKTSREWNAINKEQYAAFKALLGPDYRAPNAISQYFQKDAYGDLAPTKVDQIQRIQQDYADLIGEVYSGANGTLLPEDQEKLAFLRQQQEADIEHALTADEYADYQLRSSATAQSLKVKLSAFNPSEAEYRTLFSLQQAFDKQYNNPNLTPSADQGAERAAAEKVLEAQVATALGPDRYADYQIETDPSYAQTDRLVQRLGLPEGTTNQVMALQKSIQAQVSAVQADSSLSAGDKAAQLSLLADQATSQLTTLLGDQGMKAYPGNGGAWLGVLKQPHK